MASWPVKPTLDPVFGNRPTDGRRVNKPVQAAGMRSEPPVQATSQNCTGTLIWIDQKTGRISPISVATPILLAPKAINAASPPDDPPAVNPRLNGLTVRPKTLFTVSAIIIAGGTLVLTYKTAPASRSISTRILFSVAGCAANEERPMVESFPTILKLSFRLIGSPWRRPLGTPC